MKTAPLHRSVPSVRHSLTVLPNERSEGGRQGRRSDEWRDEPLSCHLSRYAERLIHSSRLPLRPALRALGRFLRHSSSVPSGVPQARNERRTTVGTWDTSEAPKGRPLGSLSIRLVPSVSLRSPEAFGRRRRSVATTWTARVASLPYGLRRSLLACVSQPLRGLVMWETKWRAERRAEAARGDTIQEAVRQELNFICFFILYHNLNLHS